MGNEIESEIAGTEASEMAGQGIGAGAFKKGKYESFRLTDRDVELLGFLLDQKFASLEQIYFKFFDGRKKVTDSLPANLHVTRQRLQILKRSGLISSQRVFSEPRSLYHLTALR